MEKLLDDFELYFFYFKIKVVMIYFKNVVIVDCDRKN